MGFLNPGLLGLLGLGAIPVVIHLLNRRRYQVVRWSAMEFLLKAQVKTRKRLRMENLLLLLVRTLAVLLFAFAALRPYLASSEALAALAPDRRHLYLLVDNSASMAYQEGIRTLLKRSVDEATRAVDESIRPDDPVTVVVACDDKKRGKPFAALRGIRDHERVKKFLGAIPLSDARLDPAAALAEMAAVADPGDPRRTLLVLSDFQQSDWAPPSAVDGATGPEAAEGGAGAAIQVQLERLRRMRFDLTGSFRFLGSAEVEDLALLSVGPADGRTPAEGRPVGFEVVVGNNGHAPATALVSFLVDRREIGSQRITIPGRPSRSPSPETARVSFRWTGVAGAHFAEAEVGGTGNRWSSTTDRAANDRRGHAFLVRERIRVLLVDGDPVPAGGRFPETRLLEVALSLAHGVAPTESRVIRVPDLAREDLGRSDVVVLANVERIPDEGWDRIASFVRRGGGLFVFLGDRVDASLWNAVLGRPATKDLLPARLAAVPRIDDRSPVPVELAESGHAALKDLTDPRSGSPFEPPLVSGWWPVQAPLEEGTEVLLRLRDLPRSPWLLERRHGRGRVLLCTSSADVDWTGPSLFFAPFVQEAASWLASGETVRRDLLVHEAASIEAPDTARDISVVFRPADGNYQNLPFRDERRSDPDDPGAPGVRVVSFSDTAAAGIYTLRWKAPGPGGADASPEEAAAPFAVNIDPREADAGRVRTEVLEDRYRMPGLGTAEEGGAADRERDREAARGDLTGAALGLGVLLLLSEMFLAALFGRRRR